MDEAMKATPTIWWGTHKINITDWTQCQTLMIVRFSSQGGNCEAQYTDRSCPKDHVRSYEEA
jgi:hypothetical protein